MLVKIIIVSYGTPLILAFNFDFLSPVEPVKMIPRISSRKKTLFQIWKMDQKQNTTEKI